MTYSIRTGTPGEAYQVACLIPEFAEPYPLEEYNKRLGTRPALVLVAEAGGKLVAFKAGYALNQEVFYSWMGGVLPGHRRSGIAQALMTAQETWAREHGFREIRVKTRNRHRGMLALLLVNGYDIINFEKGETIPDNRILFSKTLQE